MSAHHKEHNAVGDKDKKDSINVQQYANEHFHEPQDLQDDSHNNITSDISNIVNPSAISITNPPYQKPKQNFSNTKNPSAHTLSNLPTNMPNPSSNRTSPTNNPAKQPTTKERSSLQQQQSQQQQKLRNQLILQFKISQLQKICTTLTSANQKLLDKIQQLQQQNDQYKHRITNLDRKVQFQEEYKDGDFLESLNDSRQQQSDRVNDSYEDNNNNNNNQTYQQYKSMQQQQEQSQLLAEDDEEQKLLEEQVVDIENLIKQYRQELIKAQQINKTFKETFSQNINNLQQQLAQTQQQLSQSQLINSQLEQQLIETQQKNQSLQKEIENILNSNYFEDPTSHNRTESRSSQYITPNHRNNYHNARNIRPSYYQQDYSQQGSHFDSSVQLELQKLIQKLVNQLEHERTIKKRMTQEIKRIQKDLLQNQKEIMLKNKKIYQLQMNLLKGQKNHLFNGTILTNSQIQIVHDHKRQDKPKFSIFSPSRQQQHSRNYNSPNAKDISPKIRDKYLQQQRQRINTSAVTYSPSHRQSPVSEIYNKNREFNISRNPNISQSPSSAQTKHLQTFSLLQLLNEPTIILTIKEKLHICLKLVEFYEQKIYQYKNYNLLMLENVLVTNFNRIKLGLIKIRVQQHKRIDEGNQRMRKNSKDDIADGPEKVIWNLGFLLNSLLLDVSAKEDDLGASNGQKNVLSLIDNILDNRNINKEVFPQFREHLDGALQQRTQ